ncbi:MAG: hypothetical protein EOP61_35135 [Sphingomonadales bacterium]|nr:MAG: hypothetical protein EOP61_35135 [Sphingomonadales bacterium]
MNQATAPVRNYWRIAGVTLAFIWFFFGGIGHFVLTKTFVSIVPPYVPYPLEMVYFTGVCEIAGALALLYQPLRRIVGLCLIALAICVTPVHIQMLIEAEKYKALGPVALWVRLIIQPIFIWIIWRSTKPTEQPSAG